MTGTYASVVDGKITSATRLDGDWTPASLAASGWVLVVENPRPADTSLLTYESSIQLLASVPTKVWTSRAKSAEETTQFNQDANASTIKTQALAEIQTLITLRQNLRTGILDPTKATLNLDLASYVKDLARADMDLGKALIHTLRLITGAVDSLATGDLP